MSLPPDHLDDDFNTAAPAPAKPVDVVAAVIAELNSGYGDTSSGTRPYKSVDTLSLESHSFDPWALDVFAEIGITSAHQSPYGDNADVTRSFSLNLKDMHRLADTAPAEWQGRLQGITEKLDTEYVEQKDAYEKERAQSIADTTQQMAKLAKSVSAPKAARFSKKPA